MIPDWLVRDVCVTFALRREAKPFQKHGQVVRRFPDAPCPAYQLSIDTKSILVLETGIGERAVAAAWEWLRRRSVAQVISAGFCGALWVDLNVADVVQARELIDQHGRVWPLALIEDVSATIIDRAAGSRSLVGARKAKAALFRRTQASIVDMESAAWACHCADAEVPFSILRVVSDSADHELSPRLVRLLGRERVRPMAVLGALIRSPTLMVELIRLANRTRIASEKLAGSLGQMKLRN